MIDAFTRGHGGFIGSILCGDELFSDRCRLCGLIRDPQISQAVLSRLSSTHAL